MVVSFCAGKETVSARVLLRMAGKSRRAASALDGFIGSCDGLVIYLWKPILPPEDIRISGLSAWSPARPRPLAQAMLSGCQRGEHRVMKFLKKILLVDHEPQV